MAGEPVGQDVDVEHIESKKSSTKSKLIKIYGVETPGFSHGGVYNCICKSALSTLPRSKNRSGSIGLGSSLC